VDPVVAVHVLTYEAMHLSGRLNEAAAELAGAYWRNVYPLMPDAYRSTDCRPGGTLDERLPDAPWLARMSS
jgi:hypothetical protein